MGPCPRVLLRFRRGIFPRSSRASEVYRTPFYHSIGPRSLFSALLSQAEPMLNLQVQGEPGRPVCVPSHVRRWTSQHRTIHFGLQAPSGSIYFLTAAPQQFPLLVFFFLTQHASNSTTSTSLSSSPKHATTSASPFLTGMDHPLT